MVEHNEDPRDRKIRELETRIAARGIVETATRDRLEARIADLEKHIKVAATPKRIVEMTQREFDTLSDEEARMRFREDNRPPRQEPNPVDVAAFAEGLKDQARFNQLADEGKLFSANRASDNTGTAPVDSAQSGPG